MEEGGVEKLFLELASESRLSILRELEKRNLRTQEIANFGDLSATEAVRQLQRLSDAMLIQRKPDGSYEITQNGKTMLHLSRSFEFAHRYREYFSTHDLWQIPRHLVSRIGDLSKTKLSMDTLVNMDRGQRILTEAERFAWGIGEGHIPELMVPVMNEQQRKGVELKFLMPDKLLTDVQFEKNVEIRGLSLIPAVLVLNEKEAEICFRFIEGRVDYAGFYGGDEEFLGWTKDLFLYYWANGVRHPVSRTDY